MTRPSPDFWKRWLPALAQAAAALVAGAALPSDWRSEQPFTVSTGGLTVLSLPVGTLDAARPGLEDLRLYDEAGKEVPYLIERPVPAAKTIRRAKSFQASLNAGSTEIVLETGFAQMIDGVVLETGAVDFIKAVRVEISSDGQNWQVIARGRPVFRQGSGGEQLRVAAPAGVWPWLRLVVDDQRTPPVPFTGALVEAAASEPVPTEWIPARIAEREENSGETRLALDLGGANLSLATVQIATEEPLFTRLVAVAVPQVSEDGIREQTIGQGVMYRVAIAGQPASASLSVPLEGLVRSRELLLLIKNGDSPPLAVTGARVERRPVFLAFLARAPGVFHLLTGNSLCAAPRYDLAAPGLSLSSTPVSTFKIPPPAANPAYRAPETLAGVGSSGAPLDVSAWGFRKPVRVTGAGAQQLELDLDVVARAGPGFAALRLMRGTNQAPYILERTSASRAVAPAVTATNDAENPRLSRWIIKLPRAGLPLARLTCAARAPLFERRLSLYEELADQRGATRRHALGAASWEQTPQRQAKEFSLGLSETPESDTLVLETENGDNPPVALEHFQVFYPATRLLFQANADDGLFLYYGNAQASAPRYDLSLVAGQALAAEKKTATLSAEERLKNAARGESGAPGRGGAVFWVILAGVVAVLLVIIARLLPSPGPPSAP